MNNSANYVPEGEDRLDNPLSILGKLPIDRKVTTKDSKGGMVVFEHKDMGKGGPPRHVHQKQDEWLYVLKGEFVVEIGDERLMLKEGDSVLAPRKVPHAWAHLTDEPGSLLIVAQPAGTIEDFFSKISGHDVTQEEFAEISAEHDVELVGDPIISSEEQ